MRIRAIPVFDTPSQQRGKSPALFVTVTLNNPKLNHFSSASLIMGSRCQGRETFVEEALLGIVTTINSYLSNYVLLTLLIAMGL